MARTKNLFLKIAILAVLLPVFTTLPAWAIGESSTRFTTYVPPNNESLKRFSMLVITATGKGPGPNGETTVNIWDMPADYCLNSN